jgi:hypothetical protein
MTTATRPPGRQVATLRRLPLPVVDPPYDDELAGHGRSVVGTTPGQGVLALAFVLPSGAPARPEPMGLIVRRASAWDDDDAASAPRPTPRTDLPEPHGWTARLVQAIVEVLAGDRPASQLVRWTSEEVYVTVSRRATLAHTARAARPGPVRPVVRSVRVTEPADGVAEGCALVQRGVRATAVALRLEGIDGRWKCTALELG